MVCITLHWFATATYETLHGVTHVDVTEFLIIKCDGLQLGRVLLALLYTTLPELRGREGTWGEWSG